VQLSALMKVPITNVPARQLAGMGVTVDSEGHE